MSYKFVIKVLSFMKEEICDRGTNQSYNRWHIFPLFKEFSGSHLWHLLRGQTIQVNTIQYNTAETLNFRDEGHNPPPYNNSLCSDLGREFYKINASNILNFSILVTCTAVKNKTQHEGRLLKTITTKNDQKCKDLCRQGRNLCAGWSWNKGTTSNNCDHFSVISKEYGRNETYNSGLCEGIQETIL